jgi:hypothetical protein
MIGVEVPFPFIIPLAEALMMVVAQLQIDFIRLLGPVVGEMGIG